MNTNILKLITAIIAIFFAVTVTAQEKTHFISVMKKGAVDFRADVSHVDSVVFNKPLYVTGISLDKTTYEFYKNESYTFTATVMPNEAEIIAKPITWTSSNKSVADVDENGKITALTSGTTTITAQVEGKTATCSVTVYQGEYVIINEVKWAICNLDAPETFAAKPEDSGMFYQRGCTYGWSTTDPVINSDGFPGWKINPTSTGPTPCPAGWRAPTLEEIDKLKDKSKVRSEWTTENGVSGRRFTDIASGNSIFLPALGYRDHYSGGLSYEGRHGYYWSSTLGTNDTYALWFSENSIVSTTEERNSALSVRPVAIAE